MRGRQAPPGVEEDPWGDEFDGGVGNGRPSWHSPPPKRPPKPSSAQQRPSASRAAPGPVQAAMPEERSAGPPSLHSICLGVLAEHLPELLSDPELRDELLPLLPAHAKACLLAAARLRRLLSDAALLALADEGQAILDLHGSGELVTDEGIRAILPRMPQLRHVDLTSCSVGAATLRALGAACPAVELLRLGSKATDGSAGRALADILPALDQRQTAPAADSWDALLEVQDAAQLAAAVAGAGRLMQLQCLTWPNIPFRAEEHCRAACPKVALNPTSEQVAALHLPLACDPVVELDAPLLADVAGSQRWAHPAAAAEEGPPVMPIAERFRLAYISREQRVKAKMERNWQQQRRREIRQRSAAEVAIRQWESEL